MGSASVYRGTNPVSGSVTASTATNLIPFIDQTSSFVMSRLRLRADGHMTLNRSGTTAGFDAWLADNPAYAFIFKTGSGYTLRLDASNNNGGNGGSFANFQTTNGTSDINPAFASGSPFLFISDRLGGVRTRWTFQRSASLVGSLTDFGASITDATDMCWVKELRNDAGAITRPARMLLLTHGTSRLYELNRMTGQATLLRDLGDDGLQTATTIFQTPTALYAFDSATNTRYTLDPATYEPSNPIVLITTGLPTDSSILSACWHWREIYCILSHNQQGIAGGSELYRMGERGGQLTRVGNLTSFGAAVTQMTAIASDGQHLYGLGGQQAPRMYQIHDLTGLATEVPGTGNRFGDTDMHSPTMMDFDQVHMYFSGSEPTTLARMRYT